MQRALHGQSKVPGLGAWSWGTWDGEGPAIIFIVSLKPSFTVLWPPTWKNRVCEQGVGHWRRRAVSRVPRGSGDMNMRAA